MTDVELRKRAPGERIRLALDRLEELAVNPEHTGSLPGAIILSANLIRNAVRDIGQLDEDRLDAAAAAMHPQDWGDLNGSSCNCRQMARKAITAYLAAVGGGDSD